MPLRGLYLCVGLRCAREDRAGGYRALNIGTGSVTVGDTRAFLGTSGVQFDKLHFSLHFTYLSSHFPPANPVHFPRSRTNLFDSQYRCGTPFSTHIFAFSHFDTYAVH